VDAVFDDPGIHPLGRNRGNCHLAQHLPVTIGGDEPLPGSFAASKASQPTTVVSKLARPVSSPAW
jgi:hypothetical protein